MTISAIDPLFPQIPKIVEPAVIREILQHSLFGNSGLCDRKIKIENCEIGEKRHQPGRSFLLSYNLRLRDLESDITFEQRFTAQLCPLGSSLSDFKACLANPSYSPAGIPSISYLSEVDMLLWLFPYDRKLTHLYQLLDTDFLCAFLKKYLASLQLKPFESIQSIQTQIMHYLPEQSCMIRYSLKIAGIPVNGERSVRDIMVYGKNYADDSGLATYNIMCQLVGQINQCAQPLHYDAETKTLWQAHVPGVPFEWSLLTTFDKRNLITKVAGCIAHFHRCEVIGLKYYGYTEIEKDLKKSCKLAAAADFILGQKVQGVVNEILANHAAIVRTDADYHSPLHLDLKMGNVLIARDEVYLIDMDCVHLGDPLVDVGSFIANLYLNGLRAGSERAEIDEIVAAFINGYRAAMGGAVDERKLNWYIAAALIHEVLRRSFRQQSAARLAHIDTYLAISERYIALCQEDICNV